MGIGLLSDPSYSLPTSLPVGQFPVQPQQPTAEEIWAKIQADEAAKNAAADRRNLAGMTRKPIEPFSFGAPDASTPAVQTALGNMSAMPFGLGGATGVSGPQVGGLGDSGDAAQPAWPAPITQMQAGPAYGPGSAMPGPTAADGPSAGVTSATGEEDTPAAARPAQLTPANIGSPMPPAAPAAEPVDPSFMDRLKGFGSGLSDFGKSIAPALIGTGAALQGDNSVTMGILKDREAKALTQQNQNRTIAALRAKGLSEADIAAAVANPEILKQVAAANFGKDNLSVVQTGEDAYQRKQYGVFNKNTGEVKPLAGAGGTQAGDQPPQLSDAQQNRVKAIIEGREPYPSPSSRAKDAAVIREAVHNADPAFDAVNYASRQKTRNDFTSGKSAQNLTAFNTAIGHLGALDAAIPGLNNSRFPSYNSWIANPIAGQVDPAYQSAVKKFEASRTAVADELTRAFRGSGGNVHDIVQWEKTINAADSPEALHAAVQQAAELLGSRIDAVGDQYNRGMGTTKDALDLLNPKAAEAFRKLREGKRAEAAPAAAGKTSSGISWSVVQ